MNITEDMLAEHLANLYLKLSDDRNPDFRERYFIEITNFKSSFTKNYLNERERNWVRNNPDKAKSEHPDLGHALLQKSDEKKSHDSNLS